MRISKKFFIKNFKNIKNIKKRIHFFRCFRFCNNLEDLKKIKEGPLVVLASSALLETGFAKQLAIDWIQEEHNAILFTQPLKDDTFGHQLMQQKDQILTTTVSKRQD